MNNICTPALLGDVIEKTETINPLKSPNKEFKYIDVSSVSNNTFTIKGTKQILGKDAPSRARRLVKANDVIFATIRPTLQRIAIIPEELDNQVCSTGFFIIRPKPIVDSRYIFYWLFTDKFNTAIESLQKGASYPAISDGDVRSQPIPIPPLPEQKRIVRILDEAFESLEKARANTEKNIQNARDLFESYLNEVFTKGGEGWDEKKLGDLCIKIQDGAHESPKVQYGSPGENRYLYITSKNIRMNKLELNNISYVDKDFHNRIYPRCSPNVGDILLTKDGANTGNVALNTIDEEFSLLSSVCLIKPEPSLLLSPFLCYYLQSPIGFNMITGQMTGTAIKRIILRDIKLAMINLPNIEIQKDIISVLDKLLWNVQYLNSIYKQKLSALDELKKSILHRAFNGKL